MRILTTACFILTLSFTVSATIRTWDGGGGDNNLQTAANWVGDVAPVANDDLVFPAAATQFTGNNNYPLLTTFNSITIEGGTYTLGGSPLRLSNGLTVAAGAQTINFSITLASSQTFNMSGPTAFATLIGILMGSSGLTIDGPGTVGIGAINGSGPITKNGTGAGALIAAIAYSGSIAVNNGIFVVDANIPGSAVTVNSSSTGGVFGLSGLGGTGTVGAVNVVQGGVSAGTLTAPTGILNIAGGLTFTANGAYLCKIGGTTPGASGHDQLNVTGTVTLANARLGPLPWNAFRPAIGDSFTIIRNDGSDPVNGTFLNAPEGATFAGPLNTAFRISYVAGDGNDIAITRVPKGQFDFDADGKTDIGVFKPSTGVWSRILSSNGTVVDQHFGSNGDRIAPGDYDGDNKTDVAVFRPSNGTWYIYNSFTATVTIMQFGASGDLPVPNDFDGDGRSDIAVWRPTDGVWYEVRSLTNQVFAQQFGTNGDQPQLADFDGDGMGDLSVFRPSDGTWHFWQSGTSSYVAFPFGIAGDKPVPADYNGDGRTDTAVFRATADPNQPDFYILLSGPFTFEGASWGVPGDVPVVGDYDGDGRADIGIYRPGSATNWYILRSTGGLTAASLGEGADKPIPSAYVP